MTDFDRAIDPAAVARALLDEARRAGAAEADAVVAAGVSLSADVRGGALEHAESAEGVDVGLRVILNGRQACVSASDASARTLRALAERAVAMARVAPEDPWCGLAAPEQLARDVDASALELEDPAPPPAPAELEELARAAEAGALSVAGVSQVEGAGAAWGRSVFHLAATNGFEGGYARTTSSIHVSAIAGEGLGMERDHAAESRRRRDALPDPAEIGRLAGARAVARLGARKPPSGPVRAVFERRVAATLIGHLTAAANGAAVARGASWLRDRLGEAVLPEGFDLIEEPRRKRGPASRPFDAEGLPTAERAIVRGGVLQGWTLDLASARQLGMAPTGNAQRGAGSPPHPGVGNLRLRAPALSFDSLLRELDRGVLVTGLMGASINPTTGDYSRGAWGFWVEDGRIVHPVGEMTLAGSLPQMLRTLRAADDADEHRAFVVPSLLVEGLTLAGS
ncbi:TldD/PmbA family protein [Oceanicella actignis]|uniref:PmbA protein n=1 Tax=Oceanicella actignis TaxID=1189325 RepID=A0A1M7RRM6_9RHOB|nr:TldD/PmbA family protein [Oceanicella actignis]SET06526.1 PmbA protein [Oceanicella actignis]SHN48977.1 PmbA protein [Oceanicella actignis]